MSAASPPPRRPTMNVAPRPWTNWAKTSWPKVVVPNHHSASGGTPERADEGVRVARPQEWRGQREGEHHHEDDRGDEDLPAAQGEVGDLAPAAHRPRSRTRGRGGGPAAVASSGTAPPVGARAESPATTPIRGPWSFTPFLRSSRRASAGRRRRRRCRRGSWPRARRR